ncbi:N-formylglutamate amidohydrolase [Allosphingosinicella sp.]|jgi:N-formylglutamate amidohydrolase|uniref:N-formylglutamate amidohydrolase n=1 Tax=Allosphingosinicella sp. TaxID=2823234 RepID=UPI002F0292A1
MTHPSTSAPFFRAGPERPVSPVVLSVPHAGRDYGPALLRSARIPRSALETLEDRLVDRLVWRAVQEGAVAFIARAPRAEIDLNRDEREIDPALVAPPPLPSSLLQSARTRGGLGLVPSRISGAGAIWLHRLPGNELRRRIESIHRPYHDAVAEALAAARDRFGVAILLDCHSMPPREADGDGRPAEIVFGDRHGTSSAPEYVEAAVAAARGLGFSTACNSPYAGGHVVTRHGRPPDGVHALQIEIDRSCYLDLALREPGPGFDRTAELIAAVASALAQAAAGARPDAIAAE